MTIVPAAESPELCFLSSAASSPVKISIVAFSIESGKAEPVTYPSIPRGARVYIRTPPGWRRHDLDSGTSAGPANNAPTWE